MILGAALAIGGWFVRQMWDAVRTLKEDIQKIEVDLPTNYVQKKDLDTRLDRIDDMLDKLFEKLDKKLDK
jgi:chaperonin cofactor prefoldin